MLAALQEDWKKNMLADQFVWQIRIFDEDKFLDEDMDEYDKERENVRHIEIRQNDVKEEVEIAKNGGAAQGLGE